MLRALIAAALATLACAAPAAGSPVLVFDHGHVTKADDPALPPAEAANPLVDAPRECAVPRREGVTPLQAGDSAAVARVAAVSVGKALRRAYARGNIDQATYSAYRDVYSKGKSAWHRLGGNRGVELGAVITSVNQLAARGLLTASRMRPAFLELQRNTEWWSRTSRIPANQPSEGDTHKPHKKTACTTAARIAAARVEFKGD